MIEFEMKLQSQKIKQIELFINFITLNLVNTVFKSHK